jgi:cbb3-type cytochrome oxidase cytochrome c subunit
VTNSYNQEEAELRATIVMHTLQLNALTTAEARQRGTSRPGPSISTGDRSGPSTSILRNGLREIPPRRTTPATPVPNYPHILEKDLNVACIYAMAKMNKTYSGLETGKKHKAP